MRHLEYLQRQAVVQEAISWLRTPYHHQARIKGQGVDCAMFLGEVFHRAGLTPPVEVRSLRSLTPEQQASGGNAGFSACISIESYSPQWHLHQREEVYRGLVEQFGREIGGGLLLPGDVVLYQFGHCLSHGAIILEWPRIIHAVVQAGVIFGNGEQVVIKKHRPRRAVFFRFRGWA
jgi:cell wall-associated NlpC family hydrolase